MRQAPILDEALQRASPPACHPLTEVVAFHTYYTPKQGVHQMETRADVTPNGPLDVQIALQGGGAKLFSLVVAMREIERLEGRGRKQKNNGHEIAQPPKIRVSHVAGTSAGAIVAALYAARVPMDDVLDRLEQLTIDELLPPFRPSSRIKRVTARILHFLVRVLLRLPSDTKELLNRLNVNLGNALLGYPIYDTNGLKLQLAKLFNSSSQIRYETDPELPKWGDFRSVRFARFGHDDSVTLSVVRTELRTRKPHTASPDEFLLDFLIDSAAIPFVFRNINDENWDLLDGGICANLPSQFLHGVRRIAIGFAAPSPSRGESKWMRPLALLDAAIDYSVDRSVQLIGEENCCRLNSQLSTFDFLAIIGKEETPVKAAEERHIKNQTRDFLDYFLKRATAERWLGGDQWKFAYRSDSVAQHSALASAALRNALLTIDSLTPSKFPQKRISQEFILSIGTDNSSGAFQAEMLDERMLEVTDQIDEQEDDLVPTRYFKMTLAFPPDALITDHSFLGVIGTEDRKLVGIPCLDGGSLRTRNGDIERVVLLDLMDILRLRATYGRPHGSDGVGVRRTLSASGLIKDLFNAPSGLRANLKPSSSTAGDRRCASPTTAPS
jgi:predicted acylesterase/phospholipase RssA